MTASVLERVEALLIEAQRRVEELEATRRVLLEIADDKPAKANGHAKPAMITLRRVEHAPPTKADEPAAKKPALSRKQIEALRARILSTLEGGAMLSAAAIADRLNIKAEPERKRVYNQMQALRVNGQIARAGQGQWHLPAATG